MGVNFYAVKSKPTIADDAILHLGKSSSGWLFAFHWYPFIQDYEQFKEWLDKHVGSGEYVLLDSSDEQVSVAYLLNVIDRKQKQKLCLDNQNNFHKGVLNVNGYRFIKEDFR